FDRAPPAGRLGPWLEGHASARKRLAQKAGCGMGAARERPGDHEHECGSALLPFLMTPAKAFGRPVCRLGLASYGQTAITPDDVLSAVGRGVNFLNWQGLAEGPSSGDAFTNAVAALGTDRQSVVVCAQFGARSATDAAEELRSALAALRTDYLDVLTLYY